MWSASCRSTLSGVLRTGSCRDCDVGRARSVRHFRRAFLRVPWVLREILHGRIFSEGNGRVVHRQGFAKTYSTNLVEGAEHS